MNGTHRDTGYGIEEWGTTAAMAPKQWQSSAKGLSPVFTQKKNNYSKVLN